MKIKLDIKKFNKAIAVQVLYIHPKFLENVNFFYSTIDVKGIKRGNGKFYIKSYNEFGETPHINFCTNRVELHNSLCPSLGFKYFNSNEERDEYVDVLTRALTEWAERWEGFNIEPNIEEKDESNFIFEV